MRIRNTTDFDTKALRYLIRVVINAVANSFIKTGHPANPEWTKPWIELRRQRILVGLGKIRSCDIWVRQSRQSEPSTSGRAWVDGHKMRLSIPGGDPVSFVWLVRHEVWHLFGVQSHRLFPDAVMRESPSSLQAVKELFASDIAKVADANGLLPLKEVAPHPVMSADEKQQRRDNRKVAKVAALLERQARWEAKLKRAKKALATIQTSLRYYEKQGVLAAHRKR